MEKKTITVSSMALVRFSSQTDRAAAKVVRKASVRHGLRAKESPFPFLLALPLPTCLTGI